MVPSPTRPTQRNAGRGVPVGNLGLLILGWLWLAIVGAGSVFAQEWGLPDGDDGWEDPAPAPRSEGEGEGVVPAQEDAFPAIPGPKDAPATPPSPAPEADPQTPATGSGDPEVDPSLITPPAEAQGSPSPVVVSLQAGFWVIETRGFFYKEGYSDYDFRNDFGFTGHYPAFHGICQINFNNGLRLDLELLYHQGHESTTWPSDVDLFGEPLLSEVVVKSNVTHALFGLVAEWAILQTPDLNLGVRFGAYKVYSSVDLRLGYQVSGSITLEIPEVFFQPSITSTVGPVGGFFFKWEIIDDLVFTVAPEAFYIQTGRSTVTVVHGRSALTWAIAEKWTVGLGFRYVFIDVVMHEWPRRQTEVHVWGPDLLLSMTF